jgi:hypothetical protein
VSVALIISIQTPSLSPGNRVSVYLQVNRSRGLLSGPVSAWDYLIWVWVYKEMISYHVKGMDSVSFSVECFNYSFVFSNSSPKYHHPNAFLGLGAR